MKRKPAAVEAEKHIVIVRKLRRVIVKRQALPVLEDLREQPSAVKTVVIRRKPVVQQAVLPKAVVLPAVVSPQPPKANQPAVQAEAASAKKQGDRWSDCGQIYFTGGKAYGISPGLRTIFVGEQPYVESFLRTGALDDGLTEVQKEALRRIKEGKVRELAAVR